jgi:hypothetical protein
MGLLGSDAFQPALVVINHTVAENILRDLRRF